MISLIFDTETTGLPNKTLAIDHPDQARIMQIAIILMEGEKEVASFYSLLCPDNWPVPHPKATEAHGLTIDVCNQYGISQKLALDVIEEFREVADCVVAHNFKFDSTLLEIEQGLLGVSRSCVKPTYCTMEILTPYMQLRRANGALKWPNLTEALQWCIPGATLEDAHNALVDVRATAKIWNHLLKMNLVTVAIPAMA